MGSLTETLGTLFAAYGSKLGQAIVEHTIYVLISVAIGFALGLLLGIVFSRFPRCSSVILPILSISRPFRAWCSLAYCTSGGAIVTPPLSWH